MVAEVLRLGDGESHRDRVHVPHQDPLLPIVESEATVEVISSAGGVLVEVDPLLGVVEGAVRVGAGVGHLHRDGEGDRMIGIGL